MLLDLILIILIDMPKSDPKGSSSCQKGAEMLENNRIKLSFLNDFSDLSTFWVDLSRVESGGDVRVEYGMRSAVA